MKNSVLDDFPLCPQGPHPSKSENYILVVVSPSLFLERGPSTALRFTHVRERKVCGTPPFDYSWRMAKGGGTKGGI